MAKRLPSKVIVTSDGRVLLRRKSGYHNPIGRVRRDGSSWQGCVMPRGVSSEGQCTQKKTKHAAVLHVVRSWRRWIGLRPGRLDY